MFCVFDTEKATEQQILPTRSEQQQDKLFPSFLQEDDTTADSFVKDFYKVRGISTTFLSYTLMLRPTVCILPQV